MRHYIGSIGIPCGSVETTDLTADVTSLFRHVTCPQCIHKILTDHPEIAGEQLGGVSQFWQCPECGAEAAASTPAPAQSEPHPVDGWLERYLDYKAGRQVWPLPQPPGLPPKQTIPWPAEWLVIEVDPSAENGVRWLESVCSVTGVKIPAGEGVRCLRCAAVLAPTFQTARMVTNIDPPACPTCFPIIKGLVL